jgi:hypothetical protein
MTEYPDKTNPPMINPLHSTSGSPKEKEKEKEQSKYSVTVAICMCVNFCLAALAL